ncbi:hypothetical protein [Saccharomonospora piscinae]|uniref:hypothetical protein n=1 Tax=Saccharomonospora piscinae TaxID=687388 RepID=UPI00111BD583|nr:hypothetical protein [Saccharomonospora piscinae]
MCDVILPSEQDFFNFLGVYPASVDDGEATFLLELRQLMRSTRISFDAIERSVWIWIFDEVQKTFEIYAEGLERVSLIEVDQKKRIEFSLASAGYRLSIRLFVRPDIFLECEQFIV